MNAILNVYLTAANNGNAEAAFEAGKLMETYKWNPVTYQRQYKKSAYADYPLAQRVLGILGINGILLKDESTAGNLVYTDLKDGVEWLRKAAENNDMPARFILGKCYQLGIGVGKDDNISSILLSNAVTEISEDEVCNYSLMADMIAKRIENENREAVVKWALAG